MQIMIIGAGAAGLMAAANINHPVTVLERTEKAGKKLYITGKGRCNLTNDCLSDEFLKHVLRGEKFMMSSIHRYSPKFVMDYFESISLPLKTERGNRVFPLSDKASDVSKVLIKMAEGNGSKFIFNTFVRAIKPLESGFNIICEDKTTYFADIIVVATGGKSYPLTGSDGSFYSAMSALGHSVTPLYPSLVPLILEENVSSLKGISFKMVGVTINYKGGSAVTYGELLFTDKGVSGPAVLSASAIAAGKELDSLSLDLKPNDTNEEIDKKLLNLFNQDSNKEIKNILSMLLPKSLSSYIIDGIGFNHNKKANSITKEERLLIANSIKSLRFKIADTAGFKEAVVTSGGISLKEVSPKTMESKLHSNLFIIGETLDIDAFTGGYNLQLAWSTALAAAESINERL